MYSFHPFAGEGAFYKGNLHCHSTRSDGNKTPAQLVDSYRQQGYSFLALSEHNIFTDPVEFCSRDFITLPAVEWEADLVQNSGQVEYWRKTHHVHGIWDGARPAANPIRDGEVLPRMEYRGPETAAEMCRYLNSRGLFCIYNHPLWSKTSFSDYGRLEGFAAMEIYNYSGDVANATGDASLRWDELLDMGVRLWGVAADDNHNGGWPDDSFGGYIQVKAPELSRQAIVKAILSGAFYASSGMELHDVFLEGRTLTVRCAPAARIDFIAGPCICGGASYFAKSPSGLTEAAYDCGPDNSYVRVVCTDFQGRKAWSNPFYFEP